MKVLTNEVKLLVCGALFTSNIGLCNSHFIRAGRDSGRDLSSKSMLSNFLRNLNWIPYDTNTTTESSSVDSLPSVLDYEEKKKGCCSQNFKSCDAQWCGNTRKKCLSCGSPGSKSWLPNGPVKNCIAKWGDCTRNIDGCCHPAVCVKKNKWYRQCLQRNDPPKTSSPTKSSPATSAPTRTPTSSPTTPAPTRAPTNSPSKILSSSPSMKPIPSPSSPQNGCCSQNFKSCDVDWCGKTKEQCLSCGSLGSKIWLPNGALNSNCIARWNECGKNSNECCSPAVCVAKNIWYSQCRVQDNNTTPVPTPPPTKSITQSPTSSPTLFSKPTAAPTLSPVAAVPTVPPTTEPTQTHTFPPPTSKPTLVPTMYPTKSTASPDTSAPTGKPTTSSPTALKSSSSPTGDRDVDERIITADKSSELVIIPDPPEPSYGDKTSCPHLEKNLLDWHDPLTWGSEIPTSGDVTLPLNSKVVISQTIDGNLGLVTIPSSSELIIGENSAGIQISATGFEVFGIMRAGSETCRIDMPIDITLRGNRPTDIATNPQSESYKGISVTGTLHLHGKRYYRTWTRLAKSAIPGDTSLMLQHPVNWESDQEIVLVTTAMKDSREWHQNEVLTIDGLDSNPPTGVGSMIHLTSPVQHKHTAIHGYQAEVGLLTRMITIRGDDNDSEPKDPDSGTCAGSKSYYGDKSIPCPNRELTGFGGHIIIHNGGFGYVEGIELERMGQTNVLGRYPIHFHILGDACNNCYFKDSSIHRSFYRCVSIHGTNNLLVTENVAYDVVGYCYYLEDGVEENNTISFNLAAHIHLIGTPATGNGQTTPLSYEGPNLILPADVTASGFYITNVHNNIIGNAASGGWSGFAFPTLHSPIGAHRTANMRPSSKTGLVIDGNTAHSSGWWWYHAGTFYFGGALYYEGDTLVYNAGRDTSRGRSPCNVDHCDVSNNCGKFCQPVDQAWIQITNTKSFLAPSVGLNSWSGRMEVVGFEAHDMGLSMEALESGFWIDKMLAVCRSGENLQLPMGANVRKLKGDGFFWYDTLQEHIITNSTFRNCGYRSEAYNQYNKRDDRGCGDSDENGCDKRSTTFGFLTHSDQFTPEVMQGTKNISFENCGRRFKLHDYRGTNLPSTVSGRGQNWVDIDGSVSGLGVPTIIGSGLSDAGLWWKVDSDVVDDSQGPLKFIPQSGGPNRSVGHIRLAWDDSVHNEVGSSSCTNGGGQPCPTLGYVRHLGPMFESDKGLPVTANPDIAGPTGGFGWRLELNKGAPHTLKINFVEAAPTSPLILGMTYPLGTKFEIVAHAAYCTDNKWYSCDETFHQVNSVSEVRNSLGNTYFVDSSGFLTVRIVQTPQNFVGNPAWILPNFETGGKWGQGYALPRFARGGVTLPVVSFGPWLEIRADCERGTGNRSAFCAESPQNVSPQVCSLGYEQVAYDKCCVPGEPSSCEYA